MAPPTVVSPPHCGQPPSRVKMAASVGRSMAWLSRDLSWTGGRAHTGRVLPGRTGASGDVEQGEVEGKEGKESPLLLQAEVKGNEANTAAQVSLTEVPFVRGSRGSGYGQSHS